MADVYALLLAGGRGSRFWPLSRKKLPKQCLHLDGDLTLLGQTFARLDGLVNAGNTLVLTGGDMEQPVRAALPGLPADSFLVEPSGRNTAPCIAWGGHEVGRRTNGEGIVVVLPADHRIGRPDAFRDSIRQAIRLAKETGDIVTLGIQPNRPETGYGYLELGESVQVEGVEARTVSKFCEKPDSKRAARWVQGKTHLWNAGIFVFRVDAFMRELATHLPATSTALDRLHQDGVTIADVWGQMDATSIDYGVMEKCERILTIPIDVDWSDLGDWEAVGQHLPEIAGGTGMAAGAVAKDASGCVVHAPGQVVALLGVTDLVVVSTKDAILVMPRERAQEARSIPDLLEQAGLSAHT